MCSNLYYKEELFLIFKFYERDLRRKEIISKGYHYEGKKKKLIKLIKQKFIMQGKLFRMEVKKLQCDILLNDLFQSIDKQQEIYNFYVQLGLLIINFRLIKKIKQNLNELNEIQQKIYINFRRGNVNKRKDGVRDTISKNKSIVVDNNKIELIYNYEISYDNDQYKYIYMQQGQLLNLQRLERFYMQTLSQNGWESPLVVNAAVDFANTLIKDGRILLKQGNNTQAEMFFNRAKEITTPISITSGIFYTNTFVKSRGHAILQISQLYEQQGQYQKAWMNLRDVLPFMDKFAYSKRVNISEEDKQILKLYAQLLFHGSEVCRMMHRKDDMLDQCNKLVDILQRLGITFDSLRTLTKEEFHQEYRKWFMMLARAFYYIGKSQFKVGFERESLRNLYKAWQIQELIFGSDAPTTMKARDKYEKLSQKMEFEMIMGQEKVDFQQFKADLQKDVGQELLRKVAPLKPNKNFDHHMQKQVKSYQSIVRQLSSHSTKYQMPEYVKKVRYEYEEKLKTISNQQQIEDYQQQQEKVFQIKHQHQKSSSRGASTYMNQSLLSQDKLFSPRLSLAMHSQRNSQLMDNYMDKLKIQLQETQLKTEPIDEMMLARPQFKSEHIQLRKKTSKQGETTEQIIANKKKIKSNRLIPRMLNKQGTQMMHNKSDTQQSEQKLTKMQTVQDLNMQQQQLDEIRVPTTESVLAQQQQSPQQQTMIPHLSHVQTENTEQSDTLYNELLNKYTIEQLNVAANIIQQYFRKYKCNIKKVTTIHNIEYTPLSISKPQTQTICTDKIDTTQTNTRITSTMKVSVKELKNSIRKGGRFDQIVREIKNNEAEQISTNKAKTLVSIINDFYNLPEQELYFLGKLFFDDQIKIWKLSNISICAFSDVSQTNSQTEEDEQNYVFNTPSPIKHQLQHIMNIFTDQKAIIALQLIVFFSLQNDNQQYNLNFKINNFISYLDEYQRWFCKDRLENFNGLLSIYCKQQNLYEPNKCNTIVFLKAEFAQQLIGKLIYALKNHYYLIRSIVGYKLVSMKDAINKKLLDQIIDNTKCYRNKKIQKERKRIMVLKQFKNEPIKLIQHQYPHQEQATITLSTQRRNQIYTEEFIHEQSIEIQESDDNKSEYSHQNAIQSHKKCPSINLKSFDNSSEREQVNQPPQRKPKKQYTAIHNRNTMISPRFEPIVSSQAIIRNSLIPKIGSQFSEFAKKHKEAYEPPQSKKSLEELQEYKDRSHSEILLVREYFPEFQLANLDDYQDYQPKEGPIIKFNTQMNLEPYFPPQGIVIQPESEQFINEYPDNYVALNLILKENNTLFTSFILLQDSKSYLVINNQDGNSVKKQINIDFGMRLPDTKKKLEIINILMQEDKILKLSFIEELLSYNFRHTLILLDRYVKRINHYDIQIRNEVYEQLQADQLLPLTNINSLIYSERMASLALDQKGSQIDNDECFQQSILADSKHDSYDESVLEEKSFKNYRSKFNIMKNKFYFKDKNYYFRVEVCFKETKIFDTKLLYLSDQQAKQDLIVLKKNMHELIGQKKLQIKIRLYYPNQRLTYYRTINQLQDLEKILHIFNKTQLIGHQIRSQSKIQRRLIGKALQFKRQQITLEERNRDKYSALDQFLLMYISDPLQFISNENQRLLKQTILFYYFKQQLKLTLISSSRLRYFMNTYFLRKTFNAQSRVSNIGKVFVECEVYQFNKFYFDQENGEHTYFYFQITPQESRTKIFKLVLDLADIQSICPKVAFNNCFNDKILHDILKILTAYLVCYRTNTYHGVKIPLSYIINQSKYDLHNTFTEVTYGSNILEEQQSVRISQPKLSILLNDNGFRKKSQTQIMDVQIDNLQLPEEASRILKNTSMLTAVFRGQKFIYKTTKVVNSMYVIITVSYLSINKFQIGLYIPQTCRNFSCYIQQSDFQQMSPEFLESIFPSCLVTKETIDQFYINRWKFSEISKIYQMAVNHPEEFEDFYSEMRSQARAIPQLELQKLTESKVSINNEDELLERPNDETPKLLESFSDQSRQNVRSSTQPPIFLKKQIAKQYSVQNSLGNLNPNRLLLPTQQNIARTDKSLFFKHSPRISNQGSMENYYQSDKDLFFNQILVRKNNLDMISTFEIKIWETLMNKITITKNSQNHFIFNLDSFQGVLRENLYTQVVYLGNEVNALFEVFVENGRKPLDMFKGCVPIRLNESQNFQLYQRITLFEELKIVNFKLMLRKVLYSYYNDERRNLQNLKLKDCFADQYEFIQSDIQKCSVYMLNKLKKQLKLNPSTFIIQDVMGDDKCPQLIKVNANYKQYAAFKQYQYVLLKRMIFTMRPTQIYVSIFYQEKRRKFHLYFESMKNCKNVTIKYSLKDIQQCIPSAISLLNLGLHQELGKRIYQSFKNRLLVSTYQQLL
ncbi:unnamed protein product [Paramecium sonneborni]|uniref:Uncharacterized protein n=1 Tax=Paramecium sonneborni TaxID=65129 RepID=A0A8S1RBA7_9CILI|nr:unnamed protein product [Paramecium sonneborni]